MEKYPLIAAVIIPTATGIKERVCVVAPTISFKSSTKAPKIAGIESRNEKRTAVLFSNLQKSPPTIVLPLRLIPGRVPSP